MSLVMQTDTIRIVGGIIPQKTKVNNIKIYETSHKNKTQYCKELSHELCG